MRTYPGIESIEGRQEYEDRDGGLYYERPGLASALPPGRWVVVMGGYPTLTSASRARIEIAFTDAAGRHWVRRIDGRLEKLKQSPIVHYGLTRPLPWSMPDPCRDDI